MNADRSQKVLVVEDDADTCENLCDMLQLDGYQVECVAMARETLAKDSLDDCGAIILDRKLSNATADDLLPRLRSIAPHAYVIVTTVYADLDGAILALRHGASDYILKPINADLLLASLNRCLQIKEAQERAVQAERLDAVGTAVKSVVHESRNALQRIRSRVELIRLDHDGDLQLYQDLAAIEKASDQLQSHFNELQEISAPIVPQPEHVHCDR